MKNVIKKAILLFIIVTLTTVSAQAQSYNTGIGLRLGGLTSGLSIKHFTTGDAAIEGILSLGQNGFLITGLYEAHNPVAGAQGLKWLYGGGGHIGFFSDRGRYYYTFRGDRVYYNNASIIGVDLILGLDYKFTGAPINIGLDVKPILDFTEGTYIFFDTGLNIRYAF